MRVSTAHVYSIIGHHVPEGDAAPDGIEMFTKELVKMQIELQALEQEVTKVSISRFGGINDDNEQSDTVQTIISRFRGGLEPPEELQELEEEYQSLLERIARAREAIISGHVSDAGIDSSEYSSRVTRREIHKWVDDGTFPEYIRELEKAADRVGHRIAAKRETTNTRMMLMVSLITLGVSTLLVVFAILSLIATIL